MTEDFQHELLQVAKAMDNLARAFEHRMAELRALGDSDDQIREAVNAVQTIKDSGAIYLTWANHYAKKVSGAEESGDIEEDDVIEEE